MSEIVVTAQSRTETGKNANRRLRASGLIPGVLYGNSQQAQVVAVSPKEIASILRSGAGENTLFDLDVQGTRRKVILKDYQVEPLRSHLLHVDFYEVALDKRIKVTVHVEVQGVPVGVKTQGGLLDFITRELEVECLPLDIPKKITVDVSELALGKYVRVSDVSVPKGVTVLSDADLVIVHVVTPRAEAGAEGEAAAAPGAAEPEVIKKGKGEEGEAKAAKGDKPEKAEKKDKK
jgi:large subunit ribosomal protein L25